MPVDWRGRRATGLNVDDQTDQTRFAKVFLPHLDDAFRLARWISGARADAEDIVQEAPLRAFKGIRTFSGGNTRAWTLTIALPLPFWEVLVLREIHDLDYRSSFPMSAGRSTSCPISSSGVASSSWLSLMIVRENV